MMFGFSFVCLVLFPIFGYANVDREMSSMRIMIPSGIGNTDRRHACRLTWLRWLKHVKNVGYSFYVEAPLTDAESNKVIEEASVFHDIVILNSTAPRDVSLESCTYRRWEALLYEFSLHAEKVDYFVLADDDSFLCIHHLLSDSKFWPVGHVHISHFMRSFPDVVSIYSNTLLRDAVQIVLTNHDKTKTCHDLVSSGAIQNVTNINDIRLTFGAKRNDQGRYNDFVHGWVGADLLNATEKVTICDHVLSLHQAYPLVMIGLWDHISTRTTPGVFTKPILSRNIVDLDNARR